MATVTGFTAERMLEIENETVVDGEVRGDNLFLITREGAEIDAGNVRGPEGDIGPAGGVTEVNDQTGDVTAPRIFPDKATLDSAWASAPLGAMAVTTNNNTTWIKSSSGWLVVNNVRAFPNKANLDSTWTDAPVGAHAWTVTEAKWWTRTSTGWFDEELSQNNAIATLNTDVGNLKTSDTNQNNRLNGLDAQMLNERFWLYTPNINSHFKMMVLSHTYVTTTDGNGNATQAFSFTFSAVPRVMIQSDASFGAGWMMYIWEQYASGTTFTFLLADQNGNPRPNQLIKYNVLAIGQFA